MRRTLFLTVSLMVTVSSALADDAIFRLSGWAAINNYPGGNGRVPGTPDDTEMITLRSKVPLRTLRVQPCKDSSTGSRNGHDDAPCR